MSVDLAEPGHSFLLTFITVGSDGNVDTNSPTIIIIMNKSQERTVFSGRQLLTSTMKLRPEK